MTRNRITTRERLDEANDILQEARRADPSARLTVQYRHDGIYYIVEWTTD